MIKRNGVSVMNARSRNANEAKSVLKILDDKKYTTPNGNVIDLSNDLDEMVKNTIHIKTFHNYTTTNKKKPFIEVVNEKTGQAAARLLFSGFKDVVALNFASGRNVGGGFLAGAIAQEEDLCRASGLYLSLKSKPMFYNENIVCPDSLYTDGIIYTPNVPFYKDEYGNLLEKPFKISIISSPAPNISSMDNIDLNVLENVLFERIKKILYVASAYNHNTIILGAWGCGAFGNDPEMVAKAFKAALNQVSDFSHVCFAVYDNRDGLPIFNTFKDIFK